jgi:hypothetical protein
MWPFIGCYLPSLAIALQTLRIATNKSPTAL